MMRPAISGALTHTQDIRNEAQWRSVPAAVERCCCCWCCCRCFQRLSGKGTRTKGVSRRVVSGQTDTPRARRGGWFDTFVTERAALAGNGPPVTGEKTRRVRS